MLADLLLAFIRAALLSARASGYESIGDVLYHVDMMLASTGIMPMHCTI